MFPVVVVVICLFPSAIIPLLLIVDVLILIPMMLLSAAVSINMPKYIIYFFISDTTRIWDDPFPGMIRLQGGTYSDQGRVEVYCNGQWGTICNAGFDSIDATTLCRQLGYDDYLTYNHLPV